MWYLMNLEYGHNLNNSPKWLEKHACFPFSFSCLLSVCFKVTQMTTSLGLVATFGYHHDFLSFLEFLDI